MGIFSKIFRREGAARHPFCAALVPAAGASERMGGQDKLFAALLGKPVLAWSLQALDRCELIDEIVIATRQESILRIGELCKDYDLQKPVKIVEGGKTRMESVLQAALSASSQAKFLAVHDGVRPLVRPEVIDGAIEKAYQCAAAAPAVPVKDTVKIARDGVVESTPPRETIFAVQTPQVFDASLLKAALQSALEHGAALTDDCGAVELLGKKVYLTEGSYENLKITTPEDLLVAEKLLEARGELL